MSLSNRLKTLFSMHPDKSQADLARFAGVKPPSVNDWLSGKTKKMAGPTLMNVAVYFSVNPQWLATGEGPMELASATANLTLPSPTVTSSGSPHNSAVARMGIVVGAMNGGATQRQNTPAIGGIDNSYLQSEGDVATLVAMHPQAKHLSVTAVELGLLYDMIPVEDRVRRARALNAAMAEIVKVLENDNERPKPGPEHDLRRLPD